MTVFLPFFPAMLCHFYDIYRAWNNQRIYACFMTVSLPVSRKKKESIAKLFARASSDIRYLPEWTSATYKHTSEAVSIFTGIK